MSKHGATRRNGGGGRSSTRPASSSPSTDESPSSAVGAPLLSSTPLAFPVLPSPTYRSASLTESSAAVAVSSVDMHSIADDTSAQLATAMSCIAAFRERDVVMQHKVDVLEAGLAASVANFVRLQASIPALIAQAVQVTEPVSAQVVDFLEGSTVGLPDISDLVVEDPFSNAVGARAKEGFMLPRKEKVSLDASGVLPVTSLLEFITELHQFAKTHGNRLPFSVPWYFTPDVHRLLLHFTASRSLPPPSNSKQWLELLQAFVDTLGSFSVDEAMAAVIPYTNASAASSVSREVVLFNLYIFFDGVLQKLLGCKASSRVKADTRGKVTKAVLDGVPPPVAAYMRTALVINGYNVSTAISFVGLRECAKRAVVSIFDDPDAFASRLSLGVSVVGRGRLHDLPLTAGMVTVPV